MTTAIQSEEPNHSHNQLNRKREVMMTTHHMESYYQVARMVLSQIREFENEKKKMILVAGSERHTISLIATYLESTNLNYDVAKVNSYKEAFEFAVSLSPDLIITDCFLQEADKPDFVQQLKKNSVTMKIPFIRMEDLMTHHNEWNALQPIGAITFLRSSMNYEKLKVRVKEIFMSETLKDSENIRESILPMNGFVRDFIYAAPSPAFCQDIEGRFLICNKHFEILFDIINSDVVGKLPFEFLSSSLAQTFQTHFSSATDEGSSCIIEMEGKKGSMQLVLNYSAFEIESEIIILGMITDITNIVEANHEKLKQEKEELRSENDIKQRELAMLHELLIHSRTSKEKLIEGVNKLQPFLNIEGKSKLFSLLRQLQWELNDEMDLGVEKKFDQLHAELYQLLEKKCPEITKNEKRLCAYLRMNHGASDISKITNKSLNSINVGFARLRTKLGLPSNKDLRVYLNELSTTPS